MGYYATGGGSIELKKACNIPEEVIEQCGDAFSYYRYDPNKRIIDIQSDDKYYEADVEECLQEIAPYTENGEIYYTGEDNLQWRFVFRNGHFDEDCGHITFDGDPALDMDEEAISAMLREIVSAVLDVAESIYHTEYSYICRTSAEEKVREILKSRYII